MRVMGIDPGLQNMGFGVIEVEGRGCATWRTASSTPGRGDLAIRLLRLYDQLRAVVVEQEPDHARWSRPSSTRTRRDAEAGQARAIALLVPAQCGACPSGNMRPTP
jgi:crossover junction endodeoxyribonuclease RuvC